MQLPIVAPAPLVTAHAGVFRDLFENRCQFRHFQNYLTGLIVLPNKSMSNIVRCVLDSADRTNLSRFFSEAPWFQEQVNDRRLRYLRHQTKVARLSKNQSALVLDDTLCEHVGSLFEYIDHHYNHGDDTYPLAHNPVTSHYVSGPVRFPVDLRLYRRYEEVTRWEAFVHQHCPDREMPKTKKERTRLHKEVDAVLLQDAAFQALHQQFRTKIELAIELVEAALRHKLPFGVVLFDSWYLAEDLVAGLRAECLAAWPSGSIAFPIARRRLRRVPRGGRRLPGLVQLGAQRLHLSHQLFDQRNQFIARQSIEFVRVRQAHHARCNTKLSRKS